MSADEAGAVATSQLIALRRPYDVDHLSPVDVIAATLLVGEQIEAARAQCASLETDGDGVSALVSQGAGARALPGLTSFAAGLQRESSAVYVVVSRPAVFEINGLLRSVRPASAGSGYTRAKDTNHG